MPSRVWGMLLLIGVLAFVLGCLLCGVSLAFGPIGWTRTQVAVAGVGEWLVSFVLLISGLGVLSGAWRHFRASDLPLLPRSGVILSHLAGGCLMTLAGINGLLWPELLRMAVGLR
jgi:hypothetical protein